MARTIPNNHAARERIARCESFTNRSGSLSADWTTEFYPWGSGWLRGEDLDAWRADKSNHADPIAYVVWSYQTPIAWRTASGRWHIVAQRFSVTTSKHQGILRGALA